MKRVQPGQEQSFIGVDIAQPGQEGLIQQQRLELPLARRQQGVEIHPR